MSGTNIKAVALKPGMKFDAVIHAQTGQSVRQVEVIGEVHSVPGMVLVRDCETKTLYTVNWLKLSYDPKH